MDILEAKEHAAVEFREKVGNTIRRYREKHSIFRERSALAGALGCDPSSISRYEHGRVDIKTSTMAHASVLLEIPMYRYTESYHKNPAAIADNAEKLFKKGVPVKKRKHTSKTKTENNSNNANDYEYVFVKNTIEEEKKYFIEYMTQKCDVKKLAVMQYLSDMVDEYKDKEVPKEFTDLVKAFNAYLIKDDDKTVEKRLYAYAKAISGCD